MPRLAFSRVVAGPDVRARLDVRVEPGPRDEDRVGLAIDDGAQAVSIVVADGAGNSGRGGVAADTAAALAVTDDPRDPYARLVALDRGVAHVGAEVAVVALDVSISARALAARGAAAGDVRAWARIDGAWRELTLGVPRKPLVGSGAVPRVIAAHGASELLVATDGLRAWAGPDEDTEGDDLLSRLVAGARLPSGRLADDIGIVRVVIERGA